MKLSLPAHGSVIRYAYLWTDERERGREEGRKDRPALVVAVVRVMVLPITHTPPAKASDAVPIPPDLRRALHWDDMPCWIVTTEANAFAWPGPDIRPIPGAKPATVIYGRIPHSLLRKAARSFLANRERQRAAVVSRTPN